MKIAILGFFEMPDGGAVAQRVFMMAKGLVSLGHEVHIIVPYKFGQGELQAELQGVRVHWGALAQPGAPTTILTWLKKRQVALSTVKRVIEEGLNWLILYDLELDALPYLYLARRYHFRIATENCDIRTISKQHALKESFHFLWHKLATVLVIPYVQVNFAISNFIKNILQKIAPRVPIFIIPALVDTREFQADAQGINLFKEKFGLQDTIIIGYFGAIWNVKGYEVLLQASQKLRANGIQFKLLMTKKSLGNPAVVQLVEKLDLQDFIVLTGYLPRNELIIAMAATDILVEPKIEHEANWAAFPQKLVEYLSMGKPIVATSIGDIPLYLHDGVNALLCKPGDSEAMAEALEKLIKDPALSGRLSRHARETALQYFDCRLIARRIEAALNKSAAIPEVR